MKKYFFFFLFPAIAVLFGTIQAKAQDNFTCPDTIYVCEGWNEISFPDVSVSSPFLADFFIVSSNPFCIALFRLLIKLFQVIK
jgi:hypothetical protein